MYCAYVAGRLFAHKIVRCENFYVKNVLVIVLVVVIPKKAITNWPLHEHKLSHLFCATVTNTLHLDNFQFSTHHTFSCNRTRRTPFDTLHHAKTNMQGSDTPEWLQDNGESPPPSTDITGDQFGESQAEQSAEKSSRFACCSLGCIFLNLISLAFIGLFVYSAITQTNDVDGLQWIIFYSINAAIPAFFVVRYTFCSCFPVKLIYLFSVIATIWSIVYIVISSLNLKDGGSSGAGENENPTLRQDIIFELAGASVCLISSLYHLFITKCCIKTEDKVEDATNEENISEQV